MKKVVFFVSGVVAGVCAVVLWLELADEEDDSSGWEYNGMDLNNTPPPGYRYANYPSKILFNDPIVPNPSNFFSDPKKWWA